MPMRCLDTDLDAVFTSSGFGEADSTVTWKGAPLTGFIFDDEDVQVELGEGVGEIMHQSTLTGPYLQVVGIANDDDVTVGAGTFKVKNWLNDGTGVIEIHMEKQP